MAMTPTTERLADALTEAGAPVAMVLKARTGYYDDFKSPLTFPEMQLLADVREAGLESFAERVIDGEFDATPEESDAWAQSPEGQETFAELLQGRPRTPMEFPALIAAVDLGQRAGASGGFEFGWDDDDNPTEFYAEVAFKSHKVRGEGPHPQAAGIDLARKLLTGGKCRCGKLVALDDEGAAAFDQAQMADGTTWTADEAAAAGQCRWRLVGNRWEPSCDVPPIRVKGERF